MNSNLHVEVVPAILVHDEAELAERVLQIRGLVSMAHYDVMDGIFVPNTTLSDPSAVMARLAPLPVEVHMMVDDPIRKLAAWQAAGVHRFVIHAESVSDLDAAIASVKNVGVSVGVAVKPGTDLSVLTPVISKVDMVLIMGVEPGFSGQSHDPKTPDRVRAVREMHATIPIEVDGGVDADTAPALVQAGATILAAASYLFKSDDVADAIRRLRQS